ncbi:MAG TPA: hypothetical protein VGV35_14715 [Bryobacteraceae bacterium]|nr:hypothetical protein [Bryobacteraceae bacterium]
MNTTTRAEHFVWMIQHHPEWDGFSLEPHRALTRARSRSIQEANDLTRQLKTHWLKQIGPEQKSAMVLHNAAMFFAIREPEFAATLLKRAIELDPAEPLYVERLRLVYIGAQTPAQFLVSYGVVDSAERTAFAEQASASLKSDPAFQRYSDPEISPRFRNDSCRVQ